MSGVKGIRGRKSGPELHQNPGRSGAGWDRCRKTTIVRAGGICALCGRALMPAAPKGSKWATEVDHYPVPWHRMRDDYRDGLTTLAEFNRRANDPAGCRAVHHQCHVDRDVATGSGPGRATPPPTRSKEWDDL